MTTTAKSQYVLCLTGVRNINKRMVLFIEGILAQGLSARISSLPRGQWRLDKSEQPLIPSVTRVLSLDLGNVQMSNLHSVMCFHWLMLPLAVLIGIIARVPVLYDEHDHYELNTLESGGSRIRQLLCGLLVQWIHRVCLPWVSLVTCIHMDQSVLKKHLEQWQPAVLEIHNYPANAWRLLRRSPGTLDTTCFVYIGGVFAEKGPGVAAEAIQLLTDSERQSAELHIFGEGDNSLIDKLRQQTGVFVHNSVTPIEFRRFVASRRCCGLSLLADTPRYRLVGTNCTKLYEYLALGMPVIATRVGEFSQFVATNDIGLLIDGSMNANQLAAAMRTFLLDGEVFERMSRNAFELMSREDMSWEHEWRKVKQSSVFGFVRKVA